METGEHDAEWREGWRDGVRPDGEECIQVGDKIAMYSLMLPLSVPPSSPRLGVIG